MSESGDKTRRARRSQLVFWLVCIVAIAAVELVGSSVVRSRVVDEHDWDEAAAYVESNFEPGDLVVVSPSWADPILRQKLGALLSTQDAGRADFAPYERVWELAIRGHFHDELSEQEPAEAKRFGRVRVRRFDLGPSPVVYDLTSNFSDAEVTVEERVCPVRQRSFGRGGLFDGPMWPSERAECGPNPWLWVGQTVIEDLEKDLRFCVWQHPQAGDIPTSTTYRNVPLGDHITLHAGLYYEHERRREQGPVYLRVEVDGEVLGVMEHRDGDGWAELTVDTSGLDKETGDIAIVVSAPDPHLRTVCWAASVRQRVAGRREGLRESHGGAQ